MTEIVCPTCHGKGSVLPERVGVYPQSWHGATCNCDGPPHPWSPDWCPETGPKK